MLMNATPDRSLYAFGLNPERPGYFNLMFKSNSNAPVVTWVSCLSVRFMIVSQSTKPVKVTPEAYVFFGENLPSVPQLCDAFKMRYVPFCDFCSGSLTSLKGTLEEWRQALDLCQVV